MLQIYILRAQQLANENETDADQAAVDENEEQDDGSKISISSLFKNILMFWKKTKDIRQKSNAQRKEEDKQKNLNSNKKLLIPSNE